MEASLALHVGRGQKIQEIHSLERTTIMKTIILAAALIGGCLNQGSPETPAVPAPEGAKTVRFLCVGMETSKRFGECLGCGKDAERLTSLMRDGFGYPGYMLVSSQATKSAVVAKLREGIEATPEDGLFLFFYSGHGGQERLGGKEPDGSDRDDEFLCLYDTYMLDDEIWDIVSTCKGRVFLYFDACHSATLYRSVASELRLTDDEKKPTARAMSTETERLVSTKGFTFRPERMTKARAMSAGGQSVRLLCWSGCMEAEYSYGGINGGVLTSAVVRNWKKGCSYGGLWEAARSVVVRQQPGQNPVQTHVGGGFADEMEAFR